MNRRPVFHEGELDAQRRAHEESMAARTGEVIQPIMVAGALPFLRQQPMVIAGSENDAGEVWASILYGQPGFADPSVDAQQVRIHLDQAVPQPNDPLLTNLAQRPAVGLLFIELSTRRRVRVNGPVSRVGPTLTIDVGESYALCPKYIQKREVHMVAGSDATAGSRSGVTLEAAHVEQIRRADTFFVASSHATYGPDVSHRGGSAGFVKVLENGRLRIPDYRGNAMLSTFGNLTLNPHAGLVFADYDTRRILQLTGEATLFWDQPDPGNESGGTHRFWEFAPSAWRESEMPEGVRARFLEYSPFNPRSHGS